VAESVRFQGGQPLMWNTGHALIKTKLKETGAPLAGEMSGHMFFKERWFGFDDGLYAGARLLEIISRWKDSNWPLKHLPNAISTPELNIKMNEGEPHQLVAKLQKSGRFPGAKSLNTIDGVRAEYADGFGLVRASNTTPVVVLRFEADTQAGLQRIQNEFKAALQAAWPGIKTGF
jgi:phosphomannomutase/phosphoglucomutase